VRGLVRAIPVGLRSGEQGVVMGEGVTRGPSSVFVGRGRGMVNRGFGFEIEGYGYRRRGWGRGGYFY